MNKTEAKKMIKEFVNTNKGKSVLFHKLSKADKEAYVLTKTFNYFSSFLKAGEALTRAINNTEAHKRSNYDAFDINEHMTIKAR